MTHIPPPRKPMPGEPPRVPPVEPELLGSAVFLFSEYLRELAEAHPEAEAEDDERDAAGPAVDTRAVLDLFAENLGTGVTVTLALFMRVTALYRLLAASPSLARLALESEEDGGAFTEDALLAAARLDLEVTRRDDEVVASYDPRQFREALLSA